MPEASDYQRWDEVRGTLITYGAVFFEVENLSAETKRALVTYINHLRRRKSDEVYK